MTEFMDREEERRAEDLLARVLAKPDMYVLPDNHQAVVRWLRAFAGDLPMPTVRPHQPSQARGWAAFGMTWLADDLLPNDWLSRSRAATVGRAAYADAETTDSAFASVWWLLLRTRLDAGQFRELQVRELDALRRFGPYCPLAWQREKWIREGTFIRRPFEETHTYS